MESIICNPMPTNINPNALDTSTPCLYFSNTEPINTPKIWIKAVPTIKPTTYDQDVASSGISCP